MIQFNSPPSVRVGETYLPSANWIVTGPSPEVVEVAGRVFIFTQGETGEEYFCLAGDRVAWLWARWGYVLPLLPDGLPAVSHAWGIQRQFGAQ